MNKNLPMKKNNGLFENIKSFFKRLFFKYKKNIINNQENIILTYDNDDKEKFTNSIKLEVNTELYKEKERNELFLKIRKNPEMLNMLSVDQLDKLSKYYDKVIEKKDEIICKKRQMIENLKKNN